MDEDALDAWVEQEQEVDILLKCKDKVTPLTWVCSINWFVCKEAVRQRK